MSPTRIIKGRKLLARKTKMAKKTKKSKKGKKAKKSKKANKLRRKQKAGAMPRARVYTDEEKKAMVEWRFATLLELSDHEPAVQEIIRTLEQDGLIERYMEEYFKHLDESNQEDD